MNGSEGSRTKDRCVPNLCYLWLHFDAQIFDDLALVRLLRYAGSAWIAYGLWFSSVQATTASGQLEDNCFLDHVQIVCFFSLFNVSSSTRSLRRIFTDALTMVSYQNFYKKHELSTDQRLFNLINQEGPNNNRQTIFSWSRKPGQASHSFVIHRHHHHLRRMMTPPSLLSPQ
ncbi:hypothetical protein BT96DRAFT_234876 [Gymnopus androsaceus JB14]|uniref:Uncharacterized protein n=1 Tax=Gymnopus androsaceus JB14 TaxID=1447944 RepID=A0A6A4IPB1_9AGAR|nr:hypothetical protein BT96DRAFT_234876 [Gymnopus androsaceus JB14]